MWRYRVSGVGEAEQAQQGSTFKFRAKARSQVGAVMGREAAHTRGRACLPVTADN